MFKTGAVLPLLFAVAMLLAMLVSASRPLAATEPPSAKPATASSALKKAAAAPTIPSLPTPSRELEAFMKGFEGSWKCETVFAAGATGPGSPEAKGKGTLKIRKQFGGFSWHGEYGLAKSAALPAMSGVFQVSYDPSTKQATFVSYDSMGAAMMGAGPLAGDSVTFVEQGYMLGLKVKVHETMTKKSAKEILHRVEFDSGKSSQLMAEDICKK